MLEAQVGCVHNDSDISSSIAIANFTVGWLGRYYERMDAGSFWLLHSAIAAAGALAAILLRPIVYRLFERKIA
ncbi:hypothetical protein [Sphingosinicella rhizophila]|uniref:MFS transporter n=1 Tax=Sphingosinicella rhizophila TaxID=3050082 RepID=A0ABU3Q403_9SPHN|nr:hypothetical protein [Sphingosinicella sp. GR2756]MDT9598146.1 hypothetical protein [Sphingosinicella sp. GR2756]